jgi:hypothetical protein
MIQNAFICIILCILKSSRAELDLNSTDLECEKWKNDHVILAEDLHFKNMSFAFVKIDQVDDLNISNKCQPSEYNIEYLKIFAKKNILLNNDLNINGVLKIINRTFSKINVLFQNVNGFNENSQLENGSEKRWNNRIISFQMKNVIFDFYRKRKFLSIQECSSENFGPKTSFFGSLETLILLGKTFYNNKICPYVFMNTKLKSLFLNDISNSLIFKNRFEFLSTDATKDFDMNIKKLFLLNLHLYFEAITLDNLNPLVFKNITNLILEGNLEYIDENLFESFTKIKNIAIKSDELINFFHRGIKWISSLNRNVNVSFNNEAQLRANIHKLVSIEFDVLNWLQFNKYYTFPNEDICLFKQFPHSQLIIPLLVYSPLKFNKEEECSCTTYWLLQNYKYYFSSEFEYLHQYVNLLTEYIEYFENVTISSCVRNDDYFNEKIRSCNFSRFFENCDLTTFKTVSFSGIQEFILYLKFLQYILEVYIRTILCSIGLITNLLTLKVIRNKKHLRNFKNSMYKHIGMNALFNFFFCFVYLFSLINTCIFPKSSFCSSIWRSQFSQYFHIYVSLFLGNTLRLCCNISYIFLFVSRFALSCTSNENRLRKFIEKQNIKRFYIILFILALGFSVFFVFENYVNELFEEFDDFNANTNAYDVRYCENSKIIKIPIKINVNFGFFVKCQLFKWLNIINNILNNVLFLFISIFVDIFMMRHSYKVIKEKRAINCPHLEGAIKYKNKLNKMIITNGTLYFFSHIPEFVVTILVLFRDSPDFVALCMWEFDCNHLIEMAQTFHFISIGFQFFIFLIFDHNFQNSLRNRTVVSNR